MNQSHGREGTKGEEVEIGLGRIKLSGELVFTPGAKGIIIFAHGSGSGRLSPRNSYVAEVLHKAGLGTLLFDLLTPEEDESYENRFDIDLLASRLTGATDWVKRRSGSEVPRLAYFGASTGAAAALQASAGRADISAIVSRGGRPDLAWDYLRLVRAPTLLVVGGRDEEVINLNERALAELTIKEKQLVIVPGATHLFEEPGTLEQVARIARDWFLKFLG